MVDKKKVSTEELLQSVHILRASAAITELVATNRCFFRNSDDCPDENSCTSFNSGDCVKTNNCFAANDGSCGTLNDCALDNDGGCATRNDCTVDNDGHCAAINVCGLTNDGHCAQTNACGNINSGECREENSCIEINKASSAAPDVAIGLPDSTREALQCVEARALEEIARLIEALGLEAPEASRLRELIATRGESKAECGSVKPSKKGREKDRSK